MDEIERKWVMWNASERSRIGPIHLCHDVGPNRWREPSGTHSDSHKCNCGIGHDHVEEDFWPWDANWEPEPQWQALWRMG